MEDVKYFLEFSTIHGVTHISTSQKYVRFFWLLVVISGFIGAGVLIYHSFQSWEESPVKTTIETQPIKEIHFPKVIVCPPKNTITDLNYDIMMTKNLTLDMDTRDKLTNYSMDLLYDHIFRTMMANLSKLQDNDRYYNWYYGYTQIGLPYLYYGRLSYYLFTSASSGIISTEYFGDKFNEDKVYTDLDYNIRVYPPETVNDNTALHFEVDKVSLKYLSIGEDTITIDGYIEWKRGNNTDIMHTHKIYTPGYYKNLHLKRDVIKVDVRKQYLDFMPGFNMTWYYNGLVGEPYTRYSEDFDTNAYVRNGSIIRVFYSRYSFYHQ